jgi:peptidoglycan/LPS O-acetylase OafA/YrhL
LAGIEGSSGGARPGHGRIDDIEVLRAFAIGLVLVEHTRLNLLPWVTGEREWLYTHFGFWSGVDLFLAISGFVIARSLLPQLAQARDPGAFFNISLSFWVRRAWRLLPSAWTWLVVILAGAAAFRDSGAFQPLRPTVRSVVAGALDYANIRTMFVYGRGYVGSAFHYWSLSLEEQFYLLFPFVAFLARRRLPLVLAAIVLAQFFIYRNGPYSSVTFNMIKSDALSLGVLLAIWSGQASYRRLEPKGLERPLLQYLLPPLFLVVFSALTGAAWGPVQTRVGLAAVMAAGVVWLASYDRDILFPPGPLKRVFCWMGTRSYGLYLIHVPAFAFARELWFRVDPRYQDASLAHALILFFTGFPLLFALAELNYRFLETPLRRRGARISEAMRQRHLARRSAAAGQPAPARPGVDDEAQVRA